MSYGNWPDIDQWLRMTWGWGPEGISPAFNASNLVFGQNPPWYLDDLLAIYPNFLGPASSVTGATMEEDSNAIVFGSAPSGLAVGQFIQNSNLPKGTVITGISGSTVTVSTTATADATAQTLTVYAAPLVPIPVILIYICLANACLVKARWQDNWYVGMANFVGHYLTMWLKKQGTVPSSAAQAAQQGMNMGMLVAKSVDGVSGSYQNLMSDFASWGLWNQTWYGAELITIAAVIGAGPMVVW